LLPLARAALEPAKQRIDAMGCHGLDHKARTLEALMAGKGKA